MSFRSLRALIATLPVLVAACDSATIDGVPPNAPNGVTGTRPDTAGKTPTTPGTNGAIAGIRLTPKTITLAAGSGGSLAVTPVDAQGNPSLALLAGPLSYRSADPQIASVSDTGTVTGRAAGTTKVYASANGFIDSATVTVTGSTTPTRTGLQLFGAPSLAVGSTSWVSAVLYDAQGHVVSTRGKQAAWTIDDPRIAAIVPTPIAGDTALGTMIRAVAVGATTIRATLDGQTASFPVIVTATRTPPPDSTYTPPAPVASFDLTASVYGAAARTTPTPTDTTPSPLANATVTVYRLDAAQTTPTDTLGTRVKITSGTTDAKGLVSFKGLTGGSFYVVTVTPPAGSPFQSAETAFGPPRQADVRVGLYLTRKSGS